MANVRHYRKKTMKNLQTITFLRDPPRVRDKSAKCASVACEYKKRDTDD
jgi:hypothetical protein